MVKYVSDNEVGLNSKSYLFPFVIYSSDSVLVQQTALHIQIFHLPVTSDREIIISH